MSISLFARLHHRFGPRVDREARRRFLKVTAAVTGATLLSGQSLSRGQQVGRGKRVVVVGAGFAGLSAAYELKAAGYDVVVVEARDRISGRVLSFNDTLTKAFVPGRNVEGGGELIGNNHPCWVHYADRFKLGFLDVSASELEAPILLDGKRLSEDESNALWEGMDAVFQRMNDDARGVNFERPWETPNAKALDEVSLGTWLAALPADVDAATRRACDVQLASDNGQEVAKQSYLGMLTSVRGGDVERYWTDSEVYRCTDGNMALAFKLAEAIGKERVILGLPVSSIDASGPVVRVACRDGRTIECDDVILAVPPTVWNKISFKPGLPAALAPQLGTNLKWLAHVKQRFWEGLNLAPDSLTDSFMSQSWEGTDAQAGDGPASLNCFSGGAAADQSLALADRGRDAAYKAELEKLYPGFAENFVASRYMSWPREQWTAAGYSFPAPGQVTTVGPLLYKGLGKLHFAGEHCSYAWVGYMEGALHSGTSLARRLAARDGLVIAEIPMPPAPVKEIVEEKPESSKGPLKTPATEPATAPADAVNTPTSEPAMTR